MVYKCVPVTVDLVKAHVSMSVVSLPAGMNECPQDSFLGNNALSGLPGVTKVAFLKSMTGNTCKKFIRFLSSRVSAQPRLQWITTPFPSDTISDQSLCAFGVTTSALKVYVRTLLVMKLVARSVTVQYSTHNLQTLYFLHTECRCPLLCIQYVPSSHPSPETSYLFFFSQSLYEDARLTPQTTLDRSFHTLSIRNSPFTFKFDAI